MHLSKWMLCLVASLAELRLVALNTTQSDDSRATCAQLLGCDTCLSSCDSFYENFMQGPCKDVELPQEALYASDDDITDGLSRTRDFDYVTMEQPRWIMAWWAVRNWAEAPVWRWAGITTRLSTNIFIGHVRTYLITDVMPYGCPNYKMSFFTNSYNFPNIELMNLDFSPPKMETRRVSKPAIALELYPLHTSIRLYKLQPAVPRIPRWPSTWSTDSLEVERSHSQIGFWLSKLDSNTVLQDDPHQTFNCTMWTYVPLGEKSKDAKLVLVRVTVHPGTPELGTRKLSLKNTTRNFDVTRDSGAPIMCGLRENQKLSYIAFLSDTDPRWTKDFTGLVIARYRDTINRLIKDNPNEIASVRKAEPPIRDKTVKERRRKKIVAG